MGKTTEDTQTRAAQIVEALLGTESDMARYMSPEEFEDDALIAAVRMQVSRCCSCNTWVDTKSLDADGVCESCWSEEEND